MNAHSGIIARALFMLAVADDNRETNKKDISHTVSSIDAIYVEEKQNYAMRARICDFFCYLFRLTNLAVSLS